LISPIIVINLLAKSRFTLDNPLSKPTSLSINPPTTRKSILHFSPMNIPFTDLPSPLIKETPKIIKEEETIDTKPKVIHYKNYYNFK
jgi:hypothetical protein